MNKLTCGFIAPDSGGFIAPIKDGFESNGCTVKIFSNSSPLELDKCDFIVFCGPMQSMIPTIARISKKIKISPLIIWFTEQTPSPDSSKFAIYLAAKIRYSLEEFVHLHKVPHWVSNSKDFPLFLKRAGRIRALGEMLTLKSRNLLTLICTFTNTNAIFFEQFHLPVTVIPMGYHPQWGEDICLEKDIDVVFLGSTRDYRRRNIISELENKLSSKGIRFVIKDGSTKYGYIYGKERTILLNRTKIMLNIMRQPWDDPIFRLLLAAPNKAMLLSEKVHPMSMGPFQDGRHFAMVNLSEMAEAIEYFLSNSHEREQIAKRAYEYVTNDITMEKMCKRILEKLNYGEFSVNAS